MSESDAMALFFILYLWTAVLLAITVDLWIGTRFGRFFERCFTGLSRALEAGWNKAMRRG